jgi:dihydropteroate synthase
MLPELSFNFNGKTLACGRRPLLMGILNVTPDSFSDGGGLATPEEAVAHALAMELAGADILDIGGESTRPGAAMVSAEEEQRRVLPVIAALRGRLRIPISIDTWRAATARAAVQAGAEIINDISGLRRDPEMLKVVQETGAGAIAMHMRGTPETMQSMTDYQDLVGELVAYFAETIARCEAAGIPKSRLMLDPGIGFAKTVEQNLELIAATPRFRALGCPVLLGPSRKSFIGKLLNRPDPKDRLWGTAGAVAACARHGADVIRVHDVAEMAQLLKVFSAIPD